MNWADIVREILSDPTAKWWLLAVYLAIGPIPHEIERPDGTLVRLWKWGGLARAAMVAALGHSRLADTVARLDDAMADLTGEFRLLRGELKGRGLVSDSDRPDAPPSRRLANGAQVGRQSSHPPLDCLDPRKQPPRSTPPDNGE